MARSVTLMPWEPEYSRRERRAHHYADDTADLQIQQDNKPLDNLPMAEPGRSVFTFGQLAELQSGHSQQAAITERERQQREPKLRRIVIVPPYDGDDAIEANEERPSDEAHPISAEKRRDDISIREHDNWAWIRREDRAAESEAAEVPAHLKLNDITSGSADNQSRTRNRSGVPSPVGSCDFGQKEGTRPPHYPSETGCYQVLNPSSR